MGSSYLVRHARLSSDLRQHMSYRATVDVGLTALALLLLLPLPAAARLPRDQPYKLRLDSLATPLEAFDWPSTIA